MTTFGHQEPSPSPEDQALIELARFSIVVNAKIASVEALGGGFPDGSLYAMYRAFDYVAAAFDPVPQHDKRGRLIQPKEHLDAAGAMLVISYFHASARIGKQYDEMYEELRKRVESADVSAYLHDREGPMWLLRQAEDEYEKILPEFKGTLIDYDDASLESMSARAMAADDSERNRLILLADSWAKVCKGRYSALCSALPLFEEEMTRSDRVVDAAERIVDWIDWALLLCGAGTS